MICFLSLIAFDEHSFVVLFSLNSGLVAEKLDSELFTLERKAPATATGNFSTYIFYHFLSRYEL